MRLEKRATNESGDGYKQRESNMISRRIAALFVVATLMIVAAVPAAHAQNTVGTITQLSGAATIQRDWRDHRGSAEHADHAARSRSGRVRTHR